MTLATRFKRWHALRRARPFAPSSPEGTLVHATGIVHELEGTDTVVAPVTNKPCVILSTTYHIYDPAPRRMGSSRLLERLHVRPFVLQIATATVIVDSGHVRLLLPSIAEGSVKEEIGVAVGQRITVVGHVLRDGVERPDHDLAFRQSVVACKIVGSRKWPVVILEPRDEGSLWIFQ